MTGVGTGVPTGLPAPAAPGRLGEPLPAEAALAYLGALGDWLARRRSELDALDREVLAAPEPDRYTSDMTLAMTLWQAVAEREAQLRTLWDSGRAGADDRARMSTLVWGRRETRRTDPAPLPGRRGSKHALPFAREEEGSGSEQDPRPSGARTEGSLALSVPEACRLSDAVVGELRERLGLDPSGAETNARIAALRAQLERLRDQSLLEPAGSLRQRAGEHVVTLAARLDAAVAKAERGGDVGGILGPIEVEAATLERDLIVGGVRRREAGALVARVRTERGDLETRATALRTLADRCVATVDPAPRYAVPDVAGLGPLPNTAAALTAYSDRLRLVGRALAIAEDAYAHALRGHDDRSARLAALHVKAEATGRAEEPDVRQAYTMARAALDARPSRADLAEQLVRLYATYLGEPVTKGRAR